MNLRPQSRPTENRDTDAPSSRRCSRDDADEREGYGRSAGTSAALAGEPDCRLFFKRGPALYIVLNPDLCIVAASDAYLEATVTRRGEIVGRYVFEVFPDNPDDPSADPVVSKSLASFRRVLRTGTIDVMGLQRHDVRRPESDGSGFEVRYWSAINSTVLDPDGSVANILHRVENVTEFVLLKQQETEQARSVDTMTERTAQMKTDLSARSREVAEASRQLKELNETLEQRGRTDEVATGERGAVAVHHGSVA
ncbi:MAG: PAS domain-containing protein [Methanospirillum sp.]